jgi:hypothetical protein
MQDKNLELIIKSDSRKILPGIFGLIILFILGTFLYTLSYLFQFYVPYVFILVIQNIFLLGLILLALVINILYSKIRSTSPIAIINKDGIWIKTCGIIPWSNIEAVTMLTVGEIPQMVEIKLKNSKGLFWQSDLEGKLDIAVAKFLGCSPICLDNIDLDNNYVIWFANQFLNTEVDTNQTQLD